MGISDHFDGRRYFNPHGQSTKGFKDMLRWQLNRASNPWPAWVENKTFVRPILQKGQSRLTMINHATVLLELDGFNVITDPVFSKRVSPFSFVGPARSRPPGLEIKDLPTIDVVVVSHNHYDHLDVASLKKINTAYEPVFLVAMGDAAMLKDYGFKKVFELDWWQHHAVGKTRFTFCPSQHWSSRGLFDRQKSLWGSFMIEHGAGGPQPRKIYFAGDTGYGPHFKKTFEKLGAPDWALLPIGAYEPRWFMKDYHMNPEEAVQAMIDLHAGHAFAIHHGTFKLTDEGIDHPVRDLRAALKKHGIVDDKFVTPENGEAVFLQETVSTGAEIRS